MNINSKKQKDILRRYENAINEMYKQIQVYHVLGERSKANTLVAKYQSARRQYQIQLEMNA